MKFEHIRVMNFENAIRGMRHPKLSYHLSDSLFGIDSFEECDADFEVAERWYYYLNTEQEAEKKTLNEKCEQVDELDKFLKTFEDIKREYKLNSLSKLISSMKDLDVLNKQFDKLKSYGNSKKSSLLNTNLPTIHSMTFYSEL